MKYPPSAYKPGAVSIYNGRPCGSSDPIEVDRFATWLAAVYKPHPPQLMGKPLDSTNTATPVPIELNIPPYTSHVRLDYQCTGIGGVVAILQTDVFTVRTPIDSSDGNQHLYANALTTPVGAPMAIVDVADHELDRCLNVPLAPEWTAATLLLQVEDASVTNTLKVWHVRVTFLVPDETEELPA